MTAFVIGIIVLYLIVSAPPAPPVGWNEDFESAARTAAEQQRPMVVAFHSPGCPPCAAMDRTVLGNPDVRTALKAFVPVRVNAHARTDIAERYTVYATPTYAVIDPRGALIARVMGYHSVEDFRGFLDRALAATGEAPGD